MRLTAYMVHKPKTEREGLVHFITWMMSVSTHDVVFTSYSGYSCLTFLSEKSAHLPLQVVPLLASWNPVLHSQRKDPGSFTHLWSQPPLVLSHSLMSGEKRENKRTIQPITGPHLATRQEDKKLSLLVINGYLLSSPAFLSMQWMWIFFHHNVLEMHTWPKVDSPVHVSSLLSRVNPLLQLHMNDPSLLLHICWQLAVPLVHSSISSGKTWRKGRGSERQRGNLHKYVQLAADNESTVGQSGHLGQANYIYSFASATSSI